MVIRKRSKLGIAKAGKLRRGSRHSKIDRVTQMLWIPASRALAEALTYLALIDAQHNAHAGRDSRARRWLQTS
jgi:hypothetical protein